jgi:hypothetical protein
MRIGEPTVTHSVQYRCHHDASADENGRDLDHRAPRATVAWDSGRCRAEERSGRPVAAMSEA